MPSASATRYATFDQSTVVQWTDATNFNGFLLVSLVLPSTGSYTEAVYSNSFPQIPVPDFLVCPIINGTFSSGVGILWNADITPPNTKYISWYYDSTGRQVAGPSAVWTVTSSTASPPSATLTAPTAGTTPFTPN